MKDSANEIIYIGKARSLKARVSSYFHSSTLAPKTAALVKLVEDIEVILTANDIEALILEAELIKKHRPYYNIELKDDKKYPFIELTMADQFPRVLITRRRTKGGRRFGPYPSAESVKRVLSLIRSYFKIRTCKDKNPKRVRPCLNYQIGKCSAPCAEKIGYEEYRSSVENLIVFLEGRYSELLETLYRNMEQESEKLNFEKCASILEDIRAIEKLSKEQKVYFERKVDADYIAFYESFEELLFQILMVRDGRLLDKRAYIYTCKNDQTQGEKYRAFLMSYYGDQTQLPKRIYLAGECEELELLEEWLNVRSEHKVHILAGGTGSNSKLLKMAYENAEYNYFLLRATNRIEEKTETLQELSRLLSLPKLPNRIETYDISNTSGKLSVGSMVVFKGGMPAKSLYRKFRIKTKDTPDDFAMMKEVLHRRFTIEKKSDAWKKEFPDLIVIDGGKGQLSSAVSILNELGLKLPIVGLAKKREEIFTPGSSNPLPIPEGSPALNLLRFGRDEAHRFAITYHRHLRADLNR